MAKRIVDLTHSIYHGMPTFPLDPKTGILVHHTIDTMKYNITQIIISSHLGTHFDAPYHFFDDGKPVDEVDLNKCVGEVSVIKLEQKKPGSRITLDEIKPHADKFVKGGKVLLNTGWYKNFPEKVFYFEMPGIELPCAQWIAGTGIDMLGLDLPGVHPEEWEIVHKTFLEKEIVIIEALTNLDEIQSEKPFFVGAPLKIQGRDGSPIRAFVIDE